MEEELNKVATATPTESAGEKQGDTTTLKTNETVENEGFDNVTDEELDQEEKGQEEAENKSKTDEKKVDKTYSQKELESILEKRIGRLTAQHKKELADLETRYKEGNYSPELATAKEELAKSNEMVATLQKQLANIEIDNAFMKSNVKEEFRDYVQYKILRMVDENKDFARCLEEFKTTGENARYFNTTGGKSIVPPRPNNSSANTEVLAGENRLKKAMGI